MADYTKQEERHRRFREMLDDHGISIRSFRALSYNFWPVPVRGDKAVIDWLFKKYKSLSPDERRSLGGFGEKGIQELDKATGVKTPSKRRLMTGQQWYNKFDEIWGETYREKKNPLTADEWIDAAKRAAGLE